MTASKYITITKRMKDLTGQRFGRLVALGPVEKVITGRQCKIKWICLCDCGNTHVASGANLASGEVRSCSCLRKETITSHGMHKTRTYSSWSSMRSRCRGDAAKEQRNYTDRGITICDRWQSFDNFYADMGERPEGKSLDRKDNDGNYEPSNCRWATPQEQNNNTRFNKMLTYDGKTMTIAQWARRLGMNRSTLKGRRLRGWSDERAITTPVQVRR